MMTEGKSQIVSFESHHHDKERLTYKKKMYLFSFMTLFSAVTAQGKQHKTKTTCRHFVDCLGLMLFATLQHLCSAETACNTQNGSELLTMLYDFYLYYKCV